MNAGNFELFAPFTKIDERTGEFEAWATLEEVDAAGEIIDLDKSWPYFQALSDQFSKNTGGTNFGPLREQHDPHKASGHLIAPPAIKTRDDGTRGIFINGLPTDPVTKDKMIRRTLTGISIGGAYVGEKEDVIVGGRSAKKFVANPNHYAPVDSPCVKGALVTMVKIDGSEVQEPLQREAKQWWDCGNGDCDAKHLRKGDATNCLGLAKADDSEASRKAESASETANGYGYKAPSGRDAAEYHRKAQAAHVVASEAHTEAAVAAKGAEDGSAARQHSRMAEKHDEHATSHGAIAAAHEAAAKASGGGDMQKNDDVEFADAKNKKYPIDTAAHIRAAWCVAADTMLITNPSGPREIGRLSEGERVLSFVGQVIEQERVGKNKQTYISKRLEGGFAKAKVVALVSGGEKPLFEVRTRTKRLKASGDHQLFVLDDGEVKWKKVRDLTTKDRCLTVRSLPLNGEPQIQDEQLMRLYGYFVGDGCVGYRKTKTGEQAYSIWFSCADSNEANRYGQIIRAIWPNAKVKYRQMANHVVLTVHSKMIAEQFVQFGRGAHNKAVPAVIFKSSRTAITAFLEGYIEADGHEDKFSAVIGSCNKNLLEQCKALALMIAWRPGNVISRKVISFDKPTIAYKLAITRSPKRTSGIGRGDNHRGERIMLGNDEFMLEKIRSIKALPPAPTFDVMIAGTHNFIADGFVTHNSYINKKKNASKYAADDLLEVKGKIVAAWKAKIDKEGPPSEEIAEKATLPLVEKCLMCVSSVAYSTQTIDAMADGIHCPTCEAYGCNCRSCIGPCCGCCWNCNMRTGADEPLSDAARQMLETASVSLFDALVQIAEDCRAADAAEDSGDESVDAEKILGSLATKLRASAGTANTISKSLRVHKGNGSMVNKAKETTMSTAITPVVPATKEEKATPVVPDVAATATKGIVCNDPSGLAGDHVHSGGVCKAEHVTPENAPIMKALSGITAKLDGVNESVTKRDAEVEQLKATVDKLAKVAIKQSADIALLLGQPTEPQGALRDTSITKSADAAEEPEKPAEVAAAASHKPTADDKNGVQKSIQVATAVIEKGLLPIKNPVGSSAFGADIQ